MFLSEKVEAQLQEILTNRPNEEKEPVRRRNKKKDVIKEIKRGNGYDIKRSIINKQLTPVINGKVENLDLDKKVIHMKKLPTEKKVYYLEEMMSTEELKDKYYGYNVTQTKKHDIIELVAYRYKWVLTPLDYTPLRYTDENSLVITSDIPDVDSVPVRSYMLTDINGIQLLPFIQEVEDNMVEKLKKIIRDYYEQKIINEVYLNKYKHIDSEQAEIIRLIEKNGYHDSSKSMDNVHIRRNELNAYIRKELKRGGNFNMLDNKVDLFESREYAH